MYLLRFCLPPSLLFVTLSELFTVVLFYWHRPVGTFHVIQFPSIVIMIKMTCQDTSVSSLILAPFRLYFGCPGPNVPENRSMSLILTSTNTETSLVQSKETTSHRGPEQRSGRKGKVVTGRDHKWYRWRSRRGSWDLWVEFVRCSSLRVDQNWQVGSYLWRT